MNRSLILHFRPGMVNRRALDFTLTFGLGGMAVILIIILFCTGLLLKFYYLPFPDKAYDSISYIRNNVFFGTLIRNIHYWSANILIVISFLHLLRVFFTSAFHAPRQFNWVIGIGLFLIILLFNFTGYLLPWDQLSFWAITICTGMMEYIPLVGKWLQSVVRGGREVDSTTLTMFFTAHTALLPAGIIILLPYHFWRIRRAGGITLPASDVNNEKDNLKVKTTPDLLMREIVTALVLTAIILVISVFFDAPAGYKANPGLSPNPTKAPWYFMGFQEMLLHIHPFFAVCVIPVVVLFFLFLLPYMKYSADSKGKWFISQKGKATAVFSFTGALILSVIAIIIDEFLPDYSSFMPDTPQLISNGLFPGFLLLLIFSIFYLVLDRRYKPDKNEKIQAVFVFFLSVFITLTITGIWFRGAAMKLVWPG